MNTPISLPDEETCWQAVLARDPHYNGIFFYAVRSTRIYCRPTCPSRRPGRGQVVFYPSCEAAKAAGFRPCRRCLPHQAEDPALRLVNRAIGRIEMADTRLTLDELGSELGVSPFHLQRTFKAITGLSPRQYAAAYRANKFKSQLHDQQNITTAIYEAGYHASSRAYETTPAYLGM